MYLALITMVTRPGAQRCYQWVKEMLEKCQDRENSTEKSTCTACYVSISQNGLQLKLFGEDGLTNIDVPKWKLLNPEKLYQPTAVST